MSSHSASTAWSSVVRTSPTLPPSPSNASAMTAPCQNDAGVTENGGDGSVRFAHSGAHVIDLRKARENGVRHCAAGGFDQAIVTGREHFGRGIDNGAVGNGVSEPVGSRACGEIKRQFKVDDETLADLGLMLHYAVMRMDKQTG